MSEPGHWFESNPLWFKTAVFYEIHTRAFFDGNDDGSGDFRGLQQKLDYLQWLGIDCIWMLPFYPSPLRDGGYDIADFYGINADYGTVEDFRIFVEAEAVEPEVEPETEDLEHRLLDLGALVVQIRLVAEEAVPVVLAANRIVRPVRGLRVDEDDPRVLVALGRVRPDIPVALRARRVRA